MKNVVILGIGGIVIFSYYAINVNKYSKKNIETQTSMKETTSKQTQKSMKETTSKQTQTSTKETTDKQTQTSVYSYSDDISNNKQGINYTKEERCNRVKQFLGSVLYGKVEKDEKDETVEFTDGVFSYNSSLSNSEDNIDIDWLSVSNSLTDK